MGKFYEKPMSSFYSQANICHLSEYCSIRLLRAPELCSLFFVPQAYLLYLLLSCWFLILFCPFIYCTSWGPWSGYNMFLIVLGCLVQLKEVLQRYGLWVKVPEKWKSHQLLGSNPELFHSEASALPLGHQWLYINFVFKESLASSPSPWVWKKSPSVGIEPRNIWFRGRRYTNWATNTSW